MAEPHSDDLDEVRDDLRAEVRDQIRRLIAPGFRTLDDTLTEAQEVFADVEGEEVPEAEINRVVGELWVERLNVERAWNESGADQGDFDRLSRAFEVLAGEGYLARMNFTCCQTCGHGEIYDERAGGEVAYLFFHQQDTDNLTEEKPAVHLAYGIFPEYPGYEAVKEAGDTPKGHELYGDLELKAIEHAVGRLREQGLTVTWGGRGSRPQVALPQWRKRLPA